MNMATKKNIFEEHLREWLEAKKDKAKRGEIIQHICFTAKVHPKSIPRSFKRIQLRDRRVQEQRGRKTYYTPDVTAALKDVWEAANECCGEILHPLINEYVGIFIRDRMWKHGDEATAKLLVMSMSTVKRRVEKFKKSRGYGKGKSSTKPSLLKNIIPIFKGPWKDLPPGHFQIDTVAHCGNSLRGDFIYTVSTIDATTYWIIPRAQWNKGQEATVQNLKVVEKKFPLPILEYHPDTGSEFINWVAKKYCDKNNIRLSRSEPGKKNDNMFVEERNGHVVRKYLGYLRFDCHRCVPIMNELYSMLALYLNHFKPVRRQIEKKRIGAKQIRTYEKVALTPYQRLLERKDVPLKVIQKLQREHILLNPLFLKRKIDTLTQKIYEQQSRHKNGKCRH
jgi:hypothetical protein